MTDNNNNNCNGCNCGNTNNVINIEGLKKKKMPTKTELLDKTLTAEQEMNQKLSTIQVILSNFNKRLKETEDKMLSDTMQSVILILTLKDLITSKLNISDKEWEDAVNGVTKKLSEEREKEYDRANGFITVDKKIENGNFVIVSFDGTIDGNKFEGGSSDAALINVGSKYFLEDFENSLIGKSKNDQYTVDVKFPVDYPNKQLADKIANFKIKILSVKEKIKIEDKSDETIK